MWLFLYVLKNRMINLVNALAILAQHKSASLEILQSQERSTSKSKAQNFLSKKLTMVITPKQPMHHT